MPQAEANLVHSVAFRVTEDEWLALQRYAEAEGITIPQFAKDLLFEKVGLEVSAPRRRRYGQKGQRASKGQKQ